MIEGADWRALGTGVRLVVLDGDMAAARASVERVLGEVDRTLSRFRPDSELMTVNASAGRTVSVSPLFARTLAGALDAARRSDGAVDPTIGRALRIIGYDADFEHVAGSRRPIELRVSPVGGWSTIAFDARRRTIRVPRGIELDLGATGKGLAADLAAEAALAAAGRDAGALVSLGGDIATAGRVPAGGWRARLGPLPGRSARETVVPIPELIELDEWGYPIRPVAVPAPLLEHARRAVDSCPVLALRLTPRPRATMAPSAKRGGG